MLNKEKAIIADKLLSWYDQHRRVLPWRALPNETPDPYHVWLSEIMLQQTTVITVKPYFEKFIAQWPTVDDLAKSSQDEVLTAWAGLGYYSRARNLHKTAQIISHDYNGQFPQDIDTLKTLPGIGDYTANAIRSIAFDLPATVVDGNVERVIARLYTIKTPLPKAKAEIKTQAQELSPQNRAGDYSQAIMDFGATLCTPKNPKCDICPLGDDCRAVTQGDPTQYPFKTKKKKRPVKYATAVVAMDGTKFYIQQRDEKGLLAGMMEIPTTPWDTDKNEMQSFTEFIKKDGPYQKLTGIVRHIFTHLELRVNVVIVGKQDFLLKQGQWIEKKHIDQYALPTLMIKIINHACENKNKDSIQVNKAMIR